MAGLDRSEREEALKRKNASLEKQKVKEQKKETERSQKIRKERMNRYKRRSAAAYDTKSMLKMMALSSGILIVAFLILEAILLIWEGTFDDRSYTDHDFYWHMLNFSDTVLGFLVGLLAMDALTWYENARKARRDEQRAIIRHNRIVKPAIDMYLARKNALITPATEDLKPFQVVTDATVRDLKDMYLPSTINSDAGKARIETFFYYTKKLNVAFLNMAEDINFDYNPEICDAVLGFINETTYGMSALSTVTSFADEDKRQSRNALLRQIKSASDKTEIYEAEDELNIAMIVMHTIHAQETALAKYMDAIEDIDSEARLRERKLQ